jgi:imidazole glycerol phosphate synthase subunit HisF
MNDGVAELLVLALRALFELLVPHSLGQTAREILIALCLTGAVWLVKHVQAVMSRRVTRASVTTAAAPA